MDQLDLVGGQRWAEAVQEALERCPRVLAVLSPSAVASPNVMDEVTFALDEKKTVVPVLYRDCKVPYRLRSLHHIDCRTEYARGLKALLRALGVEQRAVAAGAGVVAAVPTEGTAYTLDDQYQVPEAGRARVERERRQAEQAGLEQEERDREAAGQGLLEEERKQLLEPETARLVAEAERSQREEAVRLVAIAEAGRKLASEQARLEREHNQAVEQARLEQQRKQAAERARLEEERKQAEEQARLEAERKQREEAVRLVAIAEAGRKLASEQARLEQGRKQAAEQAPVEAGVREKVIDWPPPELRFLSKSSAWVKAAVAAAGILIVASVLYWALRPSW